MIKVLEEAVEKVKTLSAERQRYAAHVLEAIAAAGDGVYRLSETERSAVEEGLKHDDRGEFVPDAEMETFFKRHDA